MRKFAKISLAAAVAVAGLTSVASAKPLEEAIKGVDATGYVVYQYNDNVVKNHSNDARNTSTQQNVYKAAITLTIPATEDVAVKVTGTTTRTVTGGDDDANAATSVSEANFVYSGVENLTVIAGKQAMNTPWTEGSSNINNTQTGAGLLGLYNAGFATFAAAHFVTNSTAISADVDAGNNDISVLAAIVPIMDVATAQVWYSRFGKDSNAAAFVDGGNGLVAAVDANIVDIAKVNLTHATLKIKNDNDTPKQKLTKLVVSANAGPASFAAGYARGGSNGSLVVLDNDASANFKGWDVHTSFALPKLKAYLLKAGVDVMPALNLSLTHVSAKSGDSDIDGKWQETFAQLTYKHSSNLSAFVRYGTEKRTDDFAAVLSTSNDDVKINKGRLQVAFTF